MFQPLAILPLAQLTPDVPTTIGGVTTLPAPGPAPVLNVGTPIAATSPATTTVADSQPAAKPTMLNQIMGFAPIILMFVVLYFILFRGQRKDEKKRKAMVNEMKKGDTVMTIGGLIGRIVSIDGDNVVLKIDESANVKATYTKRSIQQVLSDDDKAK